MQFPKQPRLSGGFTLVELMITVALIGVLSAIAIPNFLTYQARARRAEAYSNLTAIGRAYKSYHAERGVFPDMLTIEGEPVLPKGVPTMRKQPWDAQTQGFFDIVGFRPDGDVYYVYGVNSDCAACAGNCFTATAIGDADGDGAQGAVFFVHPDAAGNTCTDDLYGWSGPVSPNGDQIFEAPAARAPGAGTDNF